MAASETLFDYRREIDWWRELGWSEEDLQHIPVHEWQDPDHDFVPVPGTRSDSGRPLFAYRNEMSAEKWEQLSAYLSHLNQGGGQEDEQSMFSGPQHEMTDWERPAG